MTSVRLDDKTQARLAEAARRTGKTVSETMRIAIDEHCERILGQPSLAERLADVIGSVSSGGGNSRRTGEAFADLLEEQKKRNRL